MTLSAKPKKDQQENYIPYSTWSETVIKSIKSLMDECLDRFNEDKKLNIELLKMLSKLEKVIQKKYYEK